MRGGAPLERMAEPPLGTALGGPLGGRRELAPALELELEGGGGPGGGLIPLALSEPAGALKKSMSNGTT